MQKLIFLHCYDELNKVIKIAITRRGKIIAYLVPEQKSKLSVADYFNSPERPTEDFMQE